MVKDLKRAADFFCKGLGGTEVYDSHERDFSLSREKFFLIGGVWVAVMEGQPSTERTYQHVAFKVMPEDLPEFERRLRSIGVNIAPPRPHISGQGLSLYFSDFDNHLFELHTGTLEERLLTYATAH